MRVALAQVCAGLDKAANLEEVRRSLQLAAPDRPDLVVFPEAVMHDFGEPDTALATDRVP